VEELFTTAREASEPRTWSLAVELARTAEFIEQGAPDADERVVRIVRGRGDRVVTVTLSEVDCSWQCDCQEEEDPCRHVLASLIAMRQGNVSKGIVRSSGSSVGSVVHLFTREGAFLSFTRALVWGDEKIPFETTLSGALERISRGKGPVAVSKEEHQIDHVLPSKKAGVFDPRTMAFLLKGLSRVDAIELDGVRVSVSPQPLEVTVEVSDEGDGFRLRRRRIEGCREIFENGVALVNDALIALNDEQLSADQLSLIKNEGAWYPRSDALRLATQIIPALERSVPVEVLSSRLPRARRLEPRVVIETFGDERGDEVTALPRVVYGDPIVAEVFGERIEYRTSAEVPLRDKGSEAALYRRLNSELSLKPNEATVFRGEGAVTFVQRLKGWETTGGGTSSFLPAQALALRVADGEMGIDASFATSDGRFADGAEVLKAFKGGGSFVRLHDGGWGAIPRVWLEQHHEALERILAARGAPEATRATLLPYVDELCGSDSVEMPDYYARLKEGLEDPDALGEPSLPADLTVSLRSYQKTGAAWLSFLRENRLGALLADDMGLGKTLQAISVMRGRTLVVCPTSVLYGWEHQVAQFRPELKVSRYHGSSRTLDAQADVTLTSYAVMRLDIDILSDISWDMVVLDESQTIKNPDSLVSQAAFQLRAQFKVNLSGTPVENSLTDLWSQFHFLNPGLLGNRREFADRVERRVEAGDVEAGALLKKRVAPFILRRLKRDVAKELPPKTEVVLECELTSDERMVYEALLGASRDDLLASVSEGKDLFSAMEVLLRLRQACCHRGLLPGHDARDSSKVSLLMESLERSISQGHRCLVFSQWTSLLDIVEPKLIGAGISFSRIDGSTSDRGAVVEAFQADDGPSVLLLSLKAGGVGLNLTAADHVYIMDPWWNPATEDQAADRSHRIGQENPVLVHRLVARDTVEERVLELQERKRGLLAAAVGEGRDLGLTREEILALLRP
jgi:hypothetical protein